MTPGKLYTGSLACDDLVCIASKPTALRIMNTADVD